MSDVASLAGVSSMTVSRALREGASIAPATRQRIMRAVEELGYLPDKSARSLVSRRTAFVAVLVPSINNSNFADTARAMTDVLEAGGLQLLLGYTDYSVEKEERLIEAMLRRRPEGLVVTGGKHTLRARKLLENSNIPVIEMWDLPEDPILHVVGFSNAAAAGALVRFLHAKGYRRLAFVVGGTNRDQRGNERRTGYELAIRELGLEPRVIKVGMPPMSMQHGGEAIEKLLRQYPDTDAVMCTSDLVAFGAIMEARRRGWDVPGRIAVAGFGDFEVANCSFPAITTVGVHSMEIGRAVGELLLSTVESARLQRDVSRQTIVTPYEIIARESA